MTLKLFLSNKLCFLLCFSDLMRNNFFFIVYHLVKCGLMKRLINNLEVWVKSAHMSPRWLIISMQSVVGGVIVIVVSTGVRHSIAQIVSPRVGSCRV